MVDLSRMLVLSPHPDDAEIGAGGTIAKWHEQGSQIRVVVLTNCGAEMEPEFNAAMDILGIPVEHTDFHATIPVRDLPCNRGRLLNELGRYWLPMKGRKPFNPTVVLCPHSRCLHQDHVTVYEEARRAFWDHATILGYETAKMPLGGDNIVTIDTPRPYSQQRVRALQCYQSQMYSPAFMMQLVEKTQERFEPIRIHL